MSLLPRVTELTRERVSLAFDDLGPDACMAEITDELRHHNPELLDMAQRWAAAGDDTARHMQAFGVFYRALAMEAAAPPGRQRPQSAAAHFSRYPRFHRPANRPGGR